MTSTILLFLIMIITRVFCMDYIVKDENKCKKVYGDAYQPKDKYSSAYQPKDKYSSAYQYAKKLKTHYRC